METKFIEIRDRSTFIPAFAFSIDGSDHYLARRAGFQSRLIYLVSLSAQRCAYDPWNWAGGGRTYNRAHQWIEQHWDEIENGAVVDVEFILGERAEPKRSEQETVSA